MFPDLEEGCSRGPPSLEAAQAASARDALLQQLAGACHKIRRARQQGALLADRVRGLAARCERAQKSEAHVFAYNLKMRISVLHGMSAAYEEYVALQEKEVVKIFQQLMPLEGGSLAAAPEA